MAPLTLDDAEAVAVTLALKSAVDTFTGHAQVLLRALMKVHQLLPDRLRVPLGGLDQATLALPGAASPVDVDVLMALASACRDHEQARFGYRDHNGRATARAWPAMDGHGGRGRNGSWPDAPGCRPESRAVDRNDE